MEENKKPTKVIFQNAFFVVLITTCWTIIKPFLDAWLREDGLDHVLGTIFTSIYAVGPMLVMLTGSFLLTQKRVHLGFSLVYLVCCWEIGLFVFSSEPVTRIEIVNQVLFTNLLFFNVLAHIIMRPALKLTQSFEQIRDATKELNEQMHKLTATTTNKIKEADE